MRRMTTTQPWHADELLYFRGFGLTYEVDDDLRISEVHLPGGKSTWAYLLRPAREVVYPKRKHYVSYYDRNGV
jgi:hypothetical protein